MTTPMVQYAIRQVAERLEQDEAATFLAAALDDPVGALRGIAGVMPADVGQLARSAADDQVRRDLSRELRKANR